MNISSSSVQHLGLSQYLLIMIIYIVTCNSPNVILQSNDKTSYVKKSCVVFLDSIYPARIRCLLFTTDRLLL